MYYNAQYMPDAKKLTIYTYRQRYFNLCEMNYMSRNYRRKMRNWLTGRYNGTRLLYCLICICDNYVFWQLIGIYFDNCIVSEITNQSPTSLHKIHI